MLTGSFAGPQDKAPSRRQPAHAGWIAARSSLGSTGFMLKRRGYVRGSDVRGSCSCFWLLADSGRWRSDRRQRARLRLSSRVRSSSRPLLGHSSDGASGPWATERSAYCRGFLTDLACRLKALRVVIAAALHGTTGTATSATRCDSPRWVPARSDEASEASRTTGPGSKKVSRPRRAATQSAPRRREPRGAPHPIGVTPGGKR
jgi:hypothetical protein